MIDKQDVLDGIKNKKVVVFRNAFTDLPSWNVFERLYDKALEIDTAEYSGPGTLAIDRSEELLDNFDKIISVVSKAHPGKKIAVFSIIHFYNSSDNSVPDGVESFKEKFVQNNPDKLSPGFDMSMFKASRHSDPVDGFFVQCNGKALWSVFYDSGTVEYEMHPGDALYIPKDLEHSVESLNVRSSLSISFYDPE